MKKHLNAATAAFVERIALVTEAEGFARIAGRIFGLLLVSAEPLSLDDLACALGASKASVSQDARRLAQRGMIERVGRSGDRRDFYRIVDDLFVRTMELRLARWRAFHEAVCSGRRRLRSRPAEVQRRLEDFDVAFTQISAALAKSLDDWRARVAARGRRIA